MLLADAKLQGQHLGDRLLALADQLGSPEKDLLALIAGQLRGVVGRDLESPRGMFRRARRHRADYLVGIGIEHFDHILGGHLLAADAHGFIDDGSGYTHLVHRNRFLIQQLAPV